jgi:ComF family protein
MSILTQAGRCQGFLAQLRDQLLPAQCLLCSQHSGHELLCTDCAADIARLSGPTCPRCAIPTTHGERCGRCLHQPPFFSTTLAIFPYEFPVDRMIHAFKYGHQLALAGWFGEHLARRLKADDFDLILPMPLHPTRLRERGFNQAMEIARVLEKRLSRPVDRSSLHRTRATETQARLTLKARHDNMRGAFECRTELGGRNILLIDDVLTSGATANECARVLKLHGAGEIHLAVVARALNP